MNEGSDQNARAVEIDRLKRRIHRLTTDSVSRLYKKEGLIDKILERDGTVLEVLSAPCALISIDLDDFRHVNTKYGHAGGDKYLEQLSSEIDRLAWGEDDKIGFAFRGKEGDEIGVVVNVKSSDEEDYRQRVEEFKNRLNQALRELEPRLKNEGIEKKPTVSMGAFFKPKGFSNKAGGNDLVREFFADLDGPCDRALYVSKKAKETRDPDEYAHLEFYENIKS